MVAAMLTIDGSQGEGGGQVLRTALALSLVTGQPFRITRIRAGREKPGLLRQHLTAVEAAAAVGHADVRGAQLRSLELKFVPGQVTPGEYGFAVGTAGSATLVLQTVLLPLLRAAGPSRLTLSGGTHNTHAPPFDFLAKTFVPIVNRLGAVGQVSAPGATSRGADSAGSSADSADNGAGPTDSCADSDSSPVLSVQLIRHGFYPAGGGEFVATITPPALWRPIELGERGRGLRQRARALVSRLPPEIARRELRVVQSQLGWSEKHLSVEEVRDSPGPGNVVMIEIEYERITEVCTAFGARGVPAETVAQDAVAQARRYLDSNAPVGEHLTDQLLLPLALAAGGTFRTLGLTPHATTNIDVMRAFLAVTIETQRDDLGGWCVTVRT